MFATTDLVPLLAERGVVLSREQVYRLVARVPERLSLTTLSALCDILSCGPSELIEPYRAKRGRATPTRPWHRTTTADRARVLPEPQALTLMPPTEGGCRACRDGRLCTSCRSSTDHHRGRGDDPESPAAMVTDAVDAVLTGPAVTRSLAAALAADPAALLLGAPPVVGTLVGELRARGADLPDPSAPGAGAPGSH